MSRLWLSNLYPRFGYGDPFLVLRGVADMPCLRAGAGDGEPNLPTVRGIRQAADRLNV